MLTIVPFYEYYEPLTRVELTTLAQEAHSDEALAVLMAATPDDVRAVVHGYAVVRAVMEGDVDPVKRYAQVDPGCTSRRHPDSNGTDMSTPLIIASTFQYPRSVEVILCLLDHGADPNDGFVGRDGEGRVAPMAFACINSKGDMSIIERMLERGADVKDFAVVKKAIDLRKVDILEALIEHGLPLEEVWTDC